MHRHPHDFLLAIQPKEEGNYQLVFELTTPEYSDKITIDDVTVYANIDEAIKALGAAEDDGSNSVFKGTSLENRFSNRTCRFR